jgi:hypothetical protein
MPGDNDAPADGRDKEKGGKAEGADKRPVRKWTKWSKRGYAFLAALGVIGGVLGFGTQVGHWFSGLSQASDATCHMSTANVVPESPNLGISFHQDGQLAVMDYVNNAAIEIPVIDVCLKPAPFEIWFPTLGADTDIAICTSTRFAIFHQNPFAATQATYGCLAPATGAADSYYSSGILFESSPEGPPHTEIGGTRAEPASGGDEQYFVSRLAPYSGKFHTVSISGNTGNLYLVVYRYTYIPYDYTYYPEDLSKVEHFVLRFQ